MEFFIILVIIIIFLIFVNKYGRIANYPELLEIPELKEYNPKVGFDGKIHIPVVKEIGSELPPAPFATSFPAISGEPIRFTDEWKKWYNERFVEDIIGTFTVTNPLTPPIIDKIM